ncbi:restriction endonuclease subunit S [Acinetobacter sp. YH16049]|uniref:restriction endonuclease subunit S n=1 Tax=Acinetobacter sp. YH16049 TaxID=2601188 RepID=UPI0015D1D515|nr:restriction endonuclease subunit S [Acinetobacter sp. YH16049]
MSLDNLPVEWFETTLDQIAEWGSGGTPSRKNSTYYGGDVPWIKTGDLGEKYVTQATEFITDEAVKNSSAKYFKKGSVIMAMYGATIGKTSILGIDATTNQACAVGTPIATSTEFLYYFLRNEKDAFIAKGKGGAQPNISQQIIKAHTVYLPALAEQQEIVRQLDIMLAQVEQIKARLDAIPTILKKFRQSVLADAVSGELINQGFNQLSVESLSDYLTDVRYGTSKKCSESLIDAVPVLRIPNIADDGTLDFTNLKYAEFESKEIKQLQLSKGDLLLIRSNGSLDLVGKSAIADELDKVVLYAGYLIRLRFNDSVNPQFIQYFLQAPQTRQTIENIARSTSGVNNVNSKEIAGLKIQLPCIDHQNEVVLRVKQLLELSKRIEETIKSAQKRVNLLTQSILAKAFSGELTAEWREQHQELITGVNSAESLLAKIQAEREASKPAKKTRKKKEV